MKKKNGQTKHLPSCPGVPGSPFCPWDPGSPFSPLCKPSQSPIIYDKLVISHES